MNIKIKNFNYCNFENEYSLCKIKQLFGYPCLYRNLLIINKSR
jgi:hypothetical protein